MSTGPLTWKDALRPYEQPQTRRGLAQVATSLLPYLALVGGYLPDARGLDPLTIASADDRRGWIPGPHLRDLP